MVDKYRRAMIGIWAIVAGFIGASLGWALFCKTMGWPAEAFLVPVCAVGVLLVMFGTSWPDDQ